jgi:hypothetical protein
MSIRPIERLFCLQNGSGNLSDKPTRREHLQAKIDRAHAARIKAEQFIDAEGDLNSWEAGAIGVELILAAHELAREFGPNVCERHLTRPAIPDSHSAAHDVNRRANGIS